MRSIYREFIVGNDVETELTVAYGSLPRTVVGRIFLWTDIILMVSGDGRVMPVDIGRKMLVDVALDRTVSVVVKVLEFLRKEHAETESRQERAALGLVEPCAYVPLSALVEMVLQLYADKGLAGSAAAGKFRLEDQFVAGLDQTERTEAHRRLFISPVFPCVLNVAVVVGRSAEEIQFHRTKEQFAVVMQNGDDHRVLLAEKENVVPRRDLVALRRLLEV